MGTSGSDRPKFQAKPRTVMADASEPSLDELLWTIAAARVILGPEMNIQAPPNLSAYDYGQLLDAGINDWGRYFTGYARSCEPGSALA
jgi:2-iminoacetate synthase ThiH